MRVYKLCEELNSYKTNVFVLIEGKGKKIVCEIMHFLLNPYSIHDMLPMIKDQKFCCLTML